MGIWDGIRKAKPEKGKPLGLLGIEYAAAKHRWVTPLTIVLAGVLLVMFFMDACSQQV